ncbi:maltose acetyltransferase domain-containing protein [Parasedimentitalea marina]|uniref:maltose acetyltransferase domain-containing protein n=1 Tax=Parasedimentitalea marina TaxID=2483033 RepID=UPI00308402E5
MQSGDWYCCLDTELDALRHTARVAVHQHNLTPPTGAPLQSTLGRLVCRLRQPLFYRGTISLCLWDQHHFGRQCLSECRLHHS